VQCRNHLKQIALASKNYASVFGDLPGYAGEHQPFFVESAAGRTPNKALVGANWIAQTMLFLEQTELARPFTRLASDHDITPTPPVRQSVATAVGTFYCPSRRDAAAYPLFDPYLSRYGDRGARTDYAMCGGSAVVGEDDERQIINKHDGVWVLGRRTHPRDITDGLSQTYLLGEKAMDRLRYTTGDDFGDRSPLAGYTEVSATPHSYVRYAARPPGRDEADSCLSCHDFGSAHPHGWNAAMADGAVRMVSYYQDLRLHRVHASTTGGEIPDG
jgi:hypothetical protein